MKKHHSLIIIIALLTAHLTSFAYISIDNNSLNNNLQSYANVNGYIPFPCEIYAASLEIPTLPSSYDLRDHNLISPVKTQENENLCWAFASNASLESNLLKQAELYDYSEAHMSYSLSKYTGVSGYYNPWGFERTAKSGGNFLMAMAYYARGSGPVLESNDIYSSLINDRDLSITNSKPVDRYITNMYVLADNESKTAHRNKIKQLIMQYGAVNVGIYSSDIYYNDSKTAYYYPSNGEYSPNHAVTIIGWDDNYNNLNFNSSYTPSCSGAFFIKDSFGNFNNNGGYFWLSYYDKYAGYEAGCIADTKDIGYDNIHQYDPFGIVKSYSNGLSSHIYAANQYECKTGEILKAVGFNTIMENMYYEIYINKDNGSSINDLNFVFSSSPVKKGVLKYAGYHTIKLDAPLILTGNDFSVIIYFKTNGGNTVYVPFECNLDGYISQATQHTGEGFIYENEKWCDVAAFGNASLCIKALTDNPKITNDFDYNISYYDEGNIPLKNIKPGIVRTKFEVVNNTDNSMDLNGIAALYKNNKLYEIKITGISNTSNDIILNVPEGDGYYIKSIILKKNNMLMPVLKYISVLENGNTVSNKKYLVKSITLKIGETSNINLIGTTQNFYCDLTHRFTWFSGNSKIAEVTLNRKITGESAGETYIKSNDDTIPKLKVIVTN